MSEQKETQTPRPEQSDRLKALLADLDRPLEPGDWERKSSDGRRERSRNPVSKLVRARRHRRDLKDARRAAQRAFGIKTRHSTRRQATMMLTAGAVGLTAFTGPQVATPINKMPAPITAFADPTAEEAVYARKPAALLEASDAFKNALVEEEGVRYTVYRDVAGYPTVGVGHLIDPADGLSLGDRISEEQAMQFLAEDLREAERGVRQLVGDLPLHQHEFDALVDLVYNVGLGNVLPEQSPQLNAAIEARDYEGVASQLDYTHAGGAVARGLEYRSERRAAMFAEADYSDPREIGSSSRNA
ncbi:lysozyme [Qipengyuania sp. XHP0207]|uniref:lysozyme n=1 Tax=Qipengyuania sp. XHP0207 TaxID=3038078 RepID=UPI00241CDF8A|nr:lysozyme [Qipengyuania sp. XHP0207]MDG5747225.1 lysozyme [Qipengyuania sp. XHP0207]